MACFGFLYEQARAKGQADAFTKRLSEVAGAMTWRKKWDKVVRKHVLFKQEKI